MMYSEATIRFYDNIYDQSRSGIDHAFFLGKMTQVQGKILEVGVGTGRFFVDALKEGADVYGIDISPGMIDHLLNKIPSEEHHRISLADARTYRTDTPFQLILAPFRVIMHLEKVKDQLTFLETAYHNLDSGGQLIFDAFIPNIQMLANPPENRVDFDGFHEEGLRLIRKSSFKPDLIHQINHINITYLWETAPNQWKEEIWDLKLRYFYRYELAHLLSLSPFEHFQIYGGFKYEPLDNQSSDFVVTCKK